MQDTLMRFSSGTPSNLIFRRRDGHELSLSSCEKSLIHFDSEGEVFKDYGNFANTETFLSALAEFAKDADNA